MNPLYLRLKYFTGIKKGMGIDEVEIDFSSLNGLVALSGENGRGKTTVLEMCSPYSKFVSREENHMADNVFERNAEKEFIFTYKGDNYKTLLKIDNHTRKIEGYIWKNDVSEINGKISKYDKYISTLMGPSILFYNSVFCAQNATKISAMGETEIRNLFRQFVGADHLEEQSKTAGEVSKGFKAKLEAQEDQLKKFSADSEKLVDLSNDQEGLEIQIDAHKDKIEECSIDIEDKNLCLEYFTKEKSKQGIIDIQLKNFEEKKAVVESSINDLSSEKFTSIDSINTDLLTITTDKKTNEGVYLSKDLLIKNQDEIKHLKENISCCDNGIINNKQLLADLNEDLSNESTDLVIPVTISDNLKKEIADLRIKYSESSGILKNKKFELKNNKYKPSIKTLVLEIKRAEEQSETLKTRPENCDDSCKFLKIAIAYSLKLPELKIELKDILTKYKTYSVNLIKEISTLKNKCLEIKNSGALKNKELEEKEKIISDANIKIESIKSEILLSQSSISFDEDHLKDCNDKINELNIEIEKIDPVKIKIAEQKFIDLAIKKVELTDKKTRISKEFEEKEFKLFQQKREIETEISSLPEKKDFTTEFAEIETSLKILKEESETCNLLVTELISELKVNEHQIEELSEKLKEKEIIEGKIKAFKAEITKWEYLKIQTGKKGLQAIEIEAAAPLIIENTNRLLNMSFGSEFSVKIKTQDENGKEIFEIWVIDSDGEESKAGNKSGGQSVWILKAIRFAMSLISNDKSGYVFETAFGDEETGALDAKKAESLIHLYRSFMSEGGFSMNLFISHSENVVSMADSKIQFNENGIEVI